MSEPVPYTRAAIQDIRNGATAADLGWTDSRFDNVCRTHGIARSRPSPKPSGGSTQSHGHGDITFDPRSGEIIRAHIASALPLMQAAVFKVLYDRHVAGNAAFISSSDISELIPLDTSPRNIVFTMQRMEDRLAPLKCWIETKYGQNGGYRLRVDT